MLAKCPPSHLISEKTNCIESCIGLLAISTIISTFSIFSARPHTSSSYRPIRDWAPYSSSLLYLFQTYQQGVSIKQKSIHFCLFPTWVIIVYNLWSTNNIEKETVKSTDIWKYLQYSKWTHLQQYIAAQAKSRSAWQHWRGKQPIEMCFENQANIIFTNHTSVGVWKTGWTRINHLVFVLISTDDPIKCPIFWESFASIVTEIQLGHF